MIKRSFLVFLFCMVFFASISMAAPLDPIIPIKPVLPILPLHPCVLANVVVELGATDYQVLAGGGATFYSAVATHDIKVGADTIGKIVSHYSRVGPGSAAFVTSDDTIFVDTLRVFGSSSNTVANYNGARGVVKEVMVGGVKQEVRATYMFAEFNGKDSLCIFLTP